MYSILPAIAAASFLGYGIYVMLEKGLNRVSAPFLALCLTSFLWQGSWAVLFQIQDPVYAKVLVKLGYLAILVLPTTMYHFLTEISQKKEEWKWVISSYALALVLGIVTLTSNLFINGYYEYFWGYYPKAGSLHVVHVAQTVYVVSRSLYIMWCEHRTAPTQHRSQLRLSMAGLLIYSFAALDYLCNYGIGINIYYCEPCLNWCCSS
jgi:two-component system, CAI-1 autoinducer sensor kinase/phosphatase CqsS